MDARPGAANASPMDDVRVCGPVRDRCGGVHGNRTLRSYMRCSIGMVAGLTGRAMGMARDANKPRWRIGPSVLAAAASLVGAGIVYWVGQTADHGLVVPTVEEWKQSVTRWSLPALVVAAGLAWAVLQALGTGLRWYGTVLAGLVPTALLIFAMAFVTFDKGNEEWDFPISAGVLVVASATTSIAVRFASHVTPDRPADSGDR